MVAEGVNDSLKFRRSRRAPKNSLGKDPVPWSSGDVGNAIIGAAASLHPSWGFVAAQNQQKPPKSSDTEHADLV